MVSYFDRNDQKEKSPQADELNTTIFRHLNDMHSTTLSYFWLGCFPVDARLLFSMLHLCFSFYHLLFWNIN